MTTSLTLSAAPPLESPSNLVNIAPVIPISILKVVTSAAYEKEIVYVAVAILYCSLKIYEQNKAILCRARNNKKV
jgi:hypothetical protein